LTQNVANATIRGLEASLNARFARWFEIGGFLAYTDAQFDDWIEVSTCARQQFRTGCAGSTSAAIPIIIDHVGGTATVNGIVDRFQPDLFAEAPKIRWSIRPVLRLGFLGSALDSARLSANIL